MEKNMIRLENVQKVYGNEIKKIALDNVSFQIEEGEFVAIVGASGSGKSTLLNLLGGMDVATQGNYFFGDVNIATLKNRDLHEFRKSKVSFVFQRYELIHNYTVYQNVELPLRAQNVDKKKRKEIIKEVLGQLNILDLMHKYPTQISGGEQQRCAIARALVSNNQLLLADEPTGALDKKTGIQMLELLMNINKQGKTIILITHDHAIAQLANRVITLEDGQVIADERTK